MNRSKLKRLSKEDRIMALELLLTIEQNHTLEKNTLTKEELRIMKFLMNKELVCEILRPIGNMYISYIDMSSTIKECPPIEID